MKNILWLSDFLISQMGFLKIICCGGLFSYNELRMFLSPPPLFLLPQKTLCFLKTTDNQIKTTNTIDGLSGQTISSLYYRSGARKTHKRHR
jgi:hypothetical protein